MEKNRDGNSFLRRKFGRVFTSGFVVIILMAAFIAFSLKGVINIYRLNTRKKELTKSIARIKKSNKETMKQIYELTHNKQYIASLAREQLNMVKKGELVFKFIHGGEKNKNVSSAQGKGKANQRESGQKGE